MNLEGKPGVPDNWDPSTQYANSVINLNLLDNQWAPMDKQDVFKHIVGLTMAHQYSLKKGIELFGEKAKVETVKELKLILDTCTLVDP